MTERHLTFVATVEDAPPPRQGSAVVVLDTTWTPTMGDRPDLISGRQILGRVVERVDLFGTALDAVDAWAAATGIADTLTVERTTYWYRLRETMWRWVHERLLWRHALAELERQGDVDRARLDADEPALGDVLAARWPHAARSEIEPPRPDADAPQPIDAATLPSAMRSAPLGRLARLFGRAGSQRSTVAADHDTASERARRERILADRSERLAGAERPLAIVLTNPGTHQRIGAAGARQDPLFGSVIPALEERGFQPVLLATGIDQRRNEDWALVAEDDRTLPQFLLRTRWSRPEDDGRASAALEAVDAAINGSAATTLDLDGLDLTAPFVAALRTAATQIVRTDVQMLARIERLIAELRPSAILLAQEGIRTPWLVAGRAAAVPVVAVQHGVLYARHAGYADHRHPALCLASRTCVYGPYEAEALLQIAYEPDEVVVTGSPRLDLDGVVTDGAARALERQEVRQELGVNDGDRLLVVSTLNLPFVQRSHFAHMLEVVLGGPLPGIHIVFKQHPGERDDGPYRDLLLGLARATGYEAPPISVIKDVDLYRLLRAADAHLGLLSTVLTEAVMADTPNLIAMTGRLTDLLGYVDAGVATPVRSPADVRAAMAAPAHPAQADREAFLARHFLAGDAAQRIVDAVDALVATTTARVSR